MALPCVAQNPFLQTLHLQTGMTATSLCLHVVWSILNLHILFQVLPFHLPLFSHLHPVFPEGKKMYMKTITDTHQIEYYASFFSTEIKIKNLHLVNWNIKRSNCFLQQSANCLSDAKHWECTGYEQILLINVTFSPDGHACYKPSFYCMHTRIRANLPIFLWAKWAKLFNIILS